MKNFKKPTLEELEAILNGDIDVPIELLPNGEIVSKHPSQLLSDCVMLHMHFTGASDPLSKEDFKKAFEHVLMRIKNWKPETCPFDWAVRQLLISVKDEAQRASSSRCMYCEMIHELINNYN